MLRFSNRRLNSHICFSSQRQDFPFDTSEGADGLINLLDEGKINFSSPEWKSISSRGKDCIQQLLALDEDDRPSAAEALQHPWFQENLDGSLREPGTVVESVISGSKSSGSVLEPQAKRATRALIAAQLLLKKEKTAIDRVLHSMGKINDDRLSRKEVQKAYSVYFGHNLSEEGLDEMFQQVGSTEYIEYLEFVLAALNEKELLTDSRMRHAFDVFDSGSGEISINDLKEVLLDSEQGKANSMNAKAIQNIIHQLDEEGVSELMGYDEFAAMMVMASS